MARSKYESDSGLIHPINLSAARLAVAGTPPTGAVDTQVQAKVSKSNREFGIRPRRVLLSRTVGTAPNQFVRRTSLPVLTPTAFASATFAIGADITIGGTEWEIYAKQGEDF